MIEYLNSLSITEAEEVKRTIRDLFKQTCILKIKYDPVTLVSRDNPRYRICEKHKDFIRDYLSVTGCELLHDPQESIFRIGGEGIATEKMSMTTTLLVLILKLIYRDKIMGEGLRATVTNLEEIREYGKNTNLINRKLTNQEWQEALTLMKFHQMLEIPCAIVNVEDTTPLYIYSTVNIYCRTADINELVREYEEEAVQLEMKEALQPGEE
ncbi:DUF4194 domain-containing protein [Roseburia hominis]